MSIIWKNHFNHAVQIHQNLRLLCTREINSSKRVNDDDDDDDDFDDDHDENDNDDDDLNER